MPLTVVLPVLVLAIVLIGGFAWYRRAMRRLEPDDERRQVSGSRLTSEHLRRLPAPWRVVFEIGRDRLGTVDHVAIGPPGVIAVVTVMTDRPPGEISVDPALATTAIVARSGVDDLVRPVGMSCDVLAKVFWGRPAADQPAAIENSPGSVGVEGQRLEEWLVSLPTPGLTEAQIDLVWQAVTTGIGRPDPLG